MKRWTVSVVLMFLFITTLVSPQIAVSAASLEKPIVFTDKNLEAVVRKCIKKPSGPIYPSFAKSWGGTIAGGGSKIKDISSLKYFTALYGVLLWDNEISDISALREMKNLQTVYLHGNQIEDLSPLSGLNNIESIVVGRNKITNLKPLVNLKSLKTLDLSENKIVDITAIQGLSNLEALTLCYNNISDIKPVAGLTKLKSLDVRTNHIQDLGPIKKLLNLESLLINENRISDISVIAGMKKMKNLSMGNNLIKDIKQLSTMVDLKTLSMENNYISDISPLKGKTKLTWVEMFYNGVKNLEPLRGLKSITWLRVFGNPIMDYSPIENISQSVKTDRGIIEDLGKCKEVVEKVKEVTRQYIKPEMSATEKIITMMDYVKTHNTVLTHGNDLLHDFFFNGIGVCYENAHALNLLLNTVGVESYYRDGFLSPNEQSPHAWNIVKVNGEYTIVDIARGGPPFHQYTFLPDHLANRYWERESTLACSSEKSPITFRILTGEIGFVDGIYSYANQFNSNAFLKSDKSTIIYGLYKIRNDGKTQEQTLLTNNKLGPADGAGRDSIVSIGDWVYYINESDGRSIWKVTKEGKGDMEVADCKARNLFSDGQEIFYLDETDSKLHKMDANGKFNRLLLDKKLLLSSRLYDLDCIKFYGNNFYCKIDEGGISNGVSIIDREGRIINTVFSENQSSTIAYAVIDGWVYGYNSEGYYKVKTDGTEITKIDSNYTQSVFMFEKWLYQYDYNTSGKVIVHRATVDGKYKGTIEYERSIP